MMKTVLAIDLGASSGRAILGHKDGNGEIVLEEVHRFSNGFEEREGHLVWDVERLFSEILIGIKKALKACPNIASMSIDTWGVDYVLLRGEEPVYPAYCYRDSRTEKAIEKVHEIIPFERLYERTGIQFASFNTVYQLYADKMEGRLEGVTAVLMLPEYLMYRLTGQKVKEHTNAGTTGLYDASTCEPCPEIFEKLGLPSHLFEGTKRQGTFVGNFKEDIQEEVGGNIPVVLCPTHDTASAIDGLDLDFDEAYISSGTWSLLGVKQPRAVIEKAGREANYSNEFGDGYFRLQKNIMGTWILQRLAKETGKTFPEIIEMARKSNFKGTFNVNDPRFLAPANMKETISLALKEQGWTNFNEEDIFLSVHRSLATSYSFSLKELELLTKKHYSKLVIVGGGAKNDLLNRLVEEEAAVTVIPMPIEATAFGNIKSQL